MTRDTAMALLTEHTKSDSLIKHALAVEAGMRYYAERLGGDPEEWGAVGLIHDFDYERYPTAEDHPMRGAEILRERGIAERIVRAVLSHANYAGVARETPMERALYAVDELAGFIVACALVRPGRSLRGLEPKSVKKKMKDRSFAAKVNREDITQGAEELGVALDEHISSMVSALAPVAESLGLTMD